MGRETLKSFERRTENAVSEVISYCILAYTFCVVQAHLQHYTEPSAEPLPASSTLSSTTLLPLSPGTLTHNAAGVPIIVACTKADLIDENSDMLGAGASAMGAMVKGKGEEWEERTDAIMQILRTICLKCMWYFDQFIWTKAHLA